MRVAWFSLEVPDVEGGGGQRRQYHQVRALVERGHQVSVLTADTGQSARTISALAPVTRFRFRSGALRPRLQLVKSLQGSDLVVIAHLESCLMLGDLLRLVGVETVLDFQNVYSRASQNNPALGDSHQWERRERRALGLVSRAAAVSDEEARVLRKIRSAVPVAIAPNGVSADEWPPIEGGKGRLCFIGTLSHAPNLDALHWFVDRVWPRVTAGHREARLDIIGPGAVPPAITRAAGVRLVGRVPSLATALAGTSALVVPMRWGMGARVKFIEGLASGLPVVSTSLGAEGYEAAGTFMCADDEVEFAESCLELLRNDELRVRLGMRGRNLALTRYRWEETVLPLVDAGSDG